MATKLIAERMKLVVEYAAGAALAAVLYHQEKIIEILNQQDHYKIAIVLCGGNIDFTIWIDYFFTNSEHGNYIILSSNLSNRHFR